MRNSIKSTSFWTMLWIGGVNQLCGQSEDIYSVPASVLAGGGGTSSNSVYALSGTAGQPMAQLATAGPYQLQAGFWNGIAVLQSPGQPLLRITLVGNNTVVSWPVTAEGFILEETAHLGSGVWQQSVGNVVDTATEHTYSVPPTGLIRIFRLRKNNL